MATLKSLFLAGLVSAVQQPAERQDDLISLPATGPGHTTGYKYFVEAGDTTALAHYDGRFFKGEVSYSVHRTLLQGLIRSYAAFMSNHGIETWLAHGTLLGWWWNGRILPWDYDVDVQVSHDSMQLLARNLNRTGHIDTISGAGKASVANRYLLDINPHHAEIDRGNGANIIDARWIDVDNGLFVDITSVRERNSNQPGVWTCKNQHRYMRQDIWPLHLSEFEGVEALVPRNCAKILIGEYGAESLVREEYEE